MNKKVISRILVFCTIVFMVAIGINLISESNNDKLRLDLTKDRVVSTKFVNISNEYKSASNKKVDLVYFKDSVLPFMDIEEYIKMLDGVYYSRYFEFLKDKENEKLNLKFEVEYDDEEILSYEIAFDFKNDLIIVDEFDFFNIYIVPTTTNYGEGLKDLEPRITKGKSISYELSNYDFDIIIRGDKYLVPFHILNLLFNQGTYFDSYYNGEVIYGIDTSDLTDKEMKKILKTNDNKADTPESIRKASYDFLAFTLDYFYGLKDERNIKSGYDFLEEYDLSFKSKDIQKTIFDVTMKLDDLHTSHMMRGYYNYNNNGLSYVPTKLGTNVKNFYEGLAEVQKEALEHFGGNLITGNINMKEYELVNDGKVAVIYLKEFTVDTPKSIEEILKSLNSKVTDVIIDLSMNTGGNLGSVLRMFTMFTDDEIWYHTLNPLNQKKSSYGVTGETKAKFSNYNYYIKTSSVTFSAANLTASIAKELKIPVIGKKSSGGASSIGFFVLPEGSIIVMSSNMVLSRVENNNYYSIEKGIVPDYVMDKLYDEKEIIAILEKLSSKK